MSEQTTLPSYDFFMNPMLRVLERLGGSGTIDEISSGVAELSAMTDQQLQIPHGNGRGRTEFEYRLAWTRTYLKMYGLLENSSRGVWSLTPEGKSAGQVDSREIVRFVTAVSRKNQSAVVLAESAETTESDEPELIEPSWREQAMGSILAMQPDAFERLAQRLLRESGFVQVEVTGRSGDGGIDGNGILRLQGLLSFHVSFQCKRWHGVVGPAVIREFRGAMMGRADKGLVITTGAFTKEALREATREGAVAIDLIDGQQLLDRLKDLSLGITTRQVEEVQVDTSWFSTV